jgi:hypothetical protein
MKEFNQEGSEQSKGVSKGRPKISKKKWHKPRSLSKNNISLLSYQREALVTSASV